MNKFEFAEVMEVNEITSDKWNNLDIYCDDLNNVVIKGFIPLEVARIIYKKYPNQYGIYF